MTSVQIARFLLRALREALPYVEFQLAPGDDKIYEKGKHHFCAGYDDGDVIRYKFGTATPSDKWILSSLTMAELITIMDKTV